jgi:MSHA pilin protein MshC
MDHCKESRVPAATKRHLACGRGFTMIELIAVLLVIAVVVAIAMARGFSTSEYESATSLDKIKTHLRYAQMSAMGTNSVWGISFNGSTYALYQNGSTSNKVYLPGESSLDIGLPGGVSLSRIVAFDDRGRPSSVADASSLAAADLSFSVGSGVITVTKNTGYIP